MFDVAAKPTAPEADPAAADDRLKMTTDIVCAFVSHNTVAAADLPQLIRSVSDALLAASSASASPKPKELKPAVPVRKSVMEDYIVCLEDGKRFKSLKRHLRTQYSLTPEQYRERWGLPADYPMVAPNYARERSELAKRMGLGKSRDDE